MRYNATKKRARYKDQVINFLVDIMGENRLTAISQAEAWVKNGSRNLTGECKENIHYAICDIDFKKRKI